MKVLHIVPTSAKNKNLHFHGSTKDIACRTEYFLPRGYTITEAVVKRTEGDIIRTLGQYKLKAYPIIIMDVCHSFPKALRFLRKSAPRSKILLRPAYAELFHRIDWFKATSGLHKKFLWASRLFGFLAKDVLAARSVDYVLSISKWETDHYWRYVVGRSKVLDVPYFVPEQYLDSVENGKAKENLCVCLTAVKVDGNPLIVDAARNFSWVVSQLGDQYKHWEFVITGDVGHLDFIPSSVRKTGRLESPHDMLCRARAVAILSDYGRGFKTKILEAIHAKAYVLVTPGLYKRLPEEVLPFCIPVRKRSVDSFKQALEKCVAPYPNLDPNKILRDQAFSNMDKALSGAL